MKIFSICTAILIFLQNFANAEEKPGGIPDLNSLALKMSTMLNTSDTKKTLTDPLDNMIDVNAVERQKRIAIPEGTVKATTGLNRATTTSEKLIGKGFASFHNGSIETALFYYKKAVDIEPKNTEALFGAAVCYQMLGQNDDAIRAYMDILGIDSNSYQAKNNLIVLIAGKSLAGALDELIGINSKYPDNSFVLAQIGTMYSADSKYFEAMNYLGKAIQIDPSNPLYTYNMAITLDKMGKYNDAYRYYEHTLGLINPSIPLDKSVIFDRMTYIRHKSDL